MGDTEHRVVHAIALDPTVAQDSPGLPPGKGVFDLSADHVVGGVVFFFPGRQFALPGRAAVWNDETAALRLPGNGRPTTITSRVSASTTTW